MQAVLTHPVSKLLKTSLKLDDFCMHAMFLVKRMKFEINLVF